VAHYTCNIRLLYDWLVLLNSQVFTENADKHSYKTVLLGNFTGFIHEQCNFEPNDRTAGLVRQTGE
jgi:hypothetical protein